VRVPLGQRSLAGVVWDGAGDGLPDERLKPIIERLPAPRLQPELRRFVERVAAYKARQDQVKINPALAVVETTAQGDGNLLYAFKDAFQAGATLGQICDVLRGAFGTHRPV